MNGDDTLILRRRNQEWLAWMELLSKEEKEEMRSAGRHAAPA